MYRSVWGFACDTAGAEWTTWISTALPVPALFSGSLPTVGDCVHVAAARAACLEDVEVGVVECEWPPRIRLGAS